MRGRNGNLGSMIGVGLVLSLLQRDDSLEAARRAAEDPNACPHCGKRNSREATYCQRCGKPPRARRRGR